MGATMHNGAMVVSLHIHLGLSWLVHFDIANFECGKTYETAYCLQLVKSDIFHYNIKRFLAYFELRSTRCD